jgi:transposase
MRDPAHYASDGGPHVFAGIDMAKRQHEPCVVDVEGSQVLSMPFPNTHPGAVRFLTAVRKRVGDGPGAVAFCLEATGHYWLSAYCFLSGQGYRAHAINPIQSDAVRDLYIRSELARFLELHSKGRLGQGRAELIQEYARGTLARKLVAYTGIDATTSQSGQFTASRNRMSKRGSPVLRRAVWLAAVSACRFNPEFNAYYEAKKQQGKHPMAVTGAVGAALS